MTACVKECYIEPTPHIANDHETIVTTIKLGSTPWKSHSQPGRFLFAKMDEKQFFAGLEAKKDLVKTCLVSAKTYLQRSKSRKDALDILAK